MSNYVKVDKSKTELWEVFKLESEGVEFTFKVSICDNFELLADGPHQIIDDLAVLLDVYDDDDLYMVVS